jgi:hypothetical protein
VTARLDGRTGEAHLSVHLRRGVRTTAFGPNGVRHWTVPFGGDRAELLATLPRYARDPVDTACQALRAAAAADADGDLAVAQELAGRLLGVAQQARGLLMDMGEQAGEFRLLIRVHRRL